MFSERLKQFRKEKNLSQQELADMLGVVRQTVSKWEKGLSLPDAEMLIKLANALGVSVNKLLGIQMENQAVQQEIIEQLMKINEQLVIKNRRSRKIWKVFAIIFEIFVSINVILPLLAAVLFVANKTSLVSTGGKELIAEEVSAEKIKDAPALIIRDALSENLSKSKLTAKEYNWTYRDGRTGGNSATSTEHPLLLGKEFLDCLKMPEEIIVGEYYLSFKDVQSPDEITVYGWKSTEIGN